MLATVDTRKSESWNPADKTRIFDAVGRTVGFDSKYSLLFDTATDALHNCSNEEDRRRDVATQGLL